MRRRDGGSPEPLGVTLAPGGANVAVYSAHATAIEFCLFDAKGKVESERIALPERTGDVFHGFVAGIEAGQRFGLRAHGPYDPRQGHRFNPAKLLVDPYAIALDRPFALHPALFGEHAGGTERNDADSAPFVPKAIVVAPPPPACPLSPAVPWGESVLYELHVRGFSRTHPGVPEPLRGTCAGLAHPEAMAHLVRLGITTVELMPIASWVDERHLRASGLTNYWGYNPVAFMVPDPRLAPGGMAELAACVAAFHEAGIEVLLDIVLNHTGEGDEFGPTLSLRGLDNATYYRLLPGEGAAYANDAGCGNTLALDRAPVLRLAMDALRHYARAAGVDGFRFDLATTLARRDDGFDPAAPFLQAVAQDPALRALKLIAEPWDVGPGGHRRGAFPSSWGEWNDRYRDDVRRFWRGDSAMKGALATRLAGSADVFAPRSRPPSRSVNFVCAHDGFTLADLVAFERRHNEANGEDNRDGAGANHSWNHGVEGPCSDPEVLAARRRDARGVLATLLVSRGTPMISMGDELGRTQHGNNNAYAQDNALAWIDWAAADPELTKLVATLVGLRRRHRALRSDRWLAGEPVDANGIADVEWRRADGRSMGGEDWGPAKGHSLVAVFYAPAGEGAPADRVAVAFNAGREPVRIRWPDARDGFAWRRAVDTALADVTPGAAPADARGPLAPRSVVVLVEEAALVPARRRTGIEPAVLERLAAAAGILSRWHDVSGREHVVTEATQRALLDAMGLEAATTGQARERLHALATARELRRLPRVAVHQAGEPLRLALAASHSRVHRGFLRLACEDGTVRRVPFDLARCAGDRVKAVDGRTVERRWLELPGLPVGIHAIGIDDEDESGMLLVVPDRCFLPAALAAGRRRFGLAAHLYSLRRNADQGCGDFTTLAQVAQATARAGGALVGINPLHAMFATQRERASPYHPSDRRFLDPIYIDVAAVPDFADSETARGTLQEHAGILSRLGASPAVDYPAAWAVKLAVLEACFEAFTHRPSGDAQVGGFRDFVARGGERLRRFATFEALSASRPGVPWPRWPDELRRPDDPGVARFAARNARDVDFATYLQWLAECQLADAARTARAGGMSIGLYRDLAIGAAPDGAEAWATQAALARGASIGAPPDPFCLEGQNWNLPPPIPEAMAAGGYEVLRSLIAANARHAGALRIDHVMGLSRLFWIPDGGTAVEGAYVRYPLDDLLGALALESHRAGCLIVGEDLGTVAEGLRERLDAANVLSYRVLWFERDGAAFRQPQDYPAKAAACISTHDLPTIRGWWTGADIEERLALGLASVQDADAAAAGRARDKRSLVEALRATDAAASLPLDEDISHAEAATALHRFIGATPCLLALVQADDLAAEAAAINLPGTDRGRANWRRRIGVGASELWTTPIGAQAAQDLAPVRGEDP